MRRKVEGRAERKRKKEEKGKGGETAINLAKSYASMRNLIVTHANFF